MKKKCKKIILLCVISCLLLAGCTNNNNNTLTEETNVGESYLENSQYGNFIKLKSINEGLLSDYSFSETLYYDVYTKIVYLDGYYTFIPYYAPNGFPYRYNEETKDLEEIKNNT